MFRVKLFAIVLSVSTAFSTGFAQDATAPATSPQTPPPAAAASAVPTGRILWIANFSTDPNAASAVASIQASEASALQHSNLFDAVKSFATDPVQPEGTWTLESKEESFSVGSTAKRALVGFGAGRSHITMDYTLLDPQKKVVWTASLTTKPPFCAVGGIIGAVQSQKPAVDEQPQKLIDALSKFFNPDAKKKS